MTYTPSFRRPAILSIEDPWFCVLKVTLGLQFTERYVVKQLCC
jgi:hypothetical protein